MKKFLFVCAALIVLLSVTSAANAQFCFDFSAFCDGLEITKNGKNLSGTWQNYDCAGSDQAMKGRVGGNFLNNCGGGNTSGIFACRAADGCSQPGGVQWWFNIDVPLDGTIDLNQGDYPTGACFVDEVAVTVTPGACPFLGDGARPYGVTSPATDF